MGLDLAACGRLGSACAAEIIAQYGARRGASRCCRCWMGWPRPRDGTTRGPADAGWVEAVMVEHWGGPLVIAHGRRFDDTGLPGLIAGAPGRGPLRDRRRARGAGPAPRPDARPGSGTALVEALAGLLAPQGVRELWLTTTNDNLDALRFYQRRGFRLMELRAGAMEEVRKLKPTIPRIGDYGISVRDEFAAGAAVESGWGPRSCGGATLPSPDLAIAGRSAGLPASWTSTI